MNPSNQPGANVGNWSKLGFPAFRAAVRKAFKTDIPLAERDAWEAYFNARKAEVAILDGRIAELEAEINDRVHHLFGLTSDETALIEDALQGQY